MRPFVLRCMWYWNACWKWILPVSLSKLLKYLYAHRIEHPFKGVKQFGRVRCRNFNRHYHIESRGILLSHELYIVSETLKLLNPFIRLLDIGVGIQDDIEVKRCCRLHNAGSSD